MNKIVYITLGAIFVVIEVCMIVIGLSKDKTPPVISIYQENINYTFGCDNEELLKGAIAKDEKDGDVSYSITVSARVNMVPDKLESVTYSATDKEGNVSTMKVLFVTEKDGSYKLLPFENYHVNRENLQYSIEGAELAGVIDQAEVIAPSQDTVNGEDTSSTEEDTSDTETTVGEGESTDATETTTGDQETTETTTTKEVVDAGSETSTTPAGYTETNGKPQIVLAMTETTITAGSKINWVKFVDEIYDDKDSRNTLFKRIGITKNLTEELKVPGNYEQGLYVTDMDGNRSETVTVIVHVE